jgi:hypothetical protein
MQRCPSEAEPQPARHAGRSEAAPRYQFWCVNGPSVLELPLASVEVT